LEAIKLLLKEKKPTKIVGVESQRIEKILKIVEKYMTIVDVAIQQSPDITALVWAGVRLTIQV
jgi:ribosomal protein S3